MRPAVARRTEREGRRTLAPAPSTRQTGGVDTDAARLDIDDAWRRFSDGLRAYLARRVRQPADADDLLQQVFLKVAASPPDDVPEERFGAWLRRVARNVLVDASRRARVRKTDALSPDAAADEDHEAEWTGLTRCLAPMVAALPAPYADAVRRSDLDGESQRALAVELGVSHSAIKSRVQRGRRMLRERIVACCDPIDGDGMDCAPDEPCS